MLLDGLDAEVKLIRRLLDQIWSSASKTVIFFTTNPVWRFLMFFHSGLLCDGRFWENPFLTVAGRVTPHIGRTNYLACSALLAKHE